MIIVSVNLVSVYLGSGLGIFVDRKGYHKVDNLDGLKKILKKLKLLLFFYNLCPVS